MPQIPGNIPSRLAQSYIDLFYMSLFFRNATTWFSPFHTYKCKLQLPVAVS